jgi:hypothetical protein
MEVASIDHNIYFLKLSFAAPSTQAPQEITDIKFVVDGYNQILDNA